MYVLAGFLICFINNKMKKIILMSAGTFEYRVDGIYDNIEQVLEELRIQWNMPEMTEDEMYVELSNCDMKIDEGKYFPSK